MQSEIPKKLSNFAVDFTSKGSIAVGVSSPLISGFAR